MPLITRCLATFFLSIAIQTAPCEGRERVILTIDPPGSYLIHYEFSDGGEDEQAATSTGDLVADIAFDRTTLRINDVFFDGGRIFYSDTTHELDLTSDALPVLIVIESRRRASTTITTGVPGTTIEPTTGLLSNPAHAFLYDEGTVRVISSIGGVPISDDTGDLSADPATLPFNGTTIMTATFLERTALYDRIGVTLTHLTGPAQTVPIPIINNTLSITDNGGFTANGEIVLPSEIFENWANSRGYPTPVTLTDLHPSTREPLALLYAFRVTEGGRLPQLEIDVAGGELVLALPTGGLVAAVQIESNDSLAGGGWDVWELEPGQVTRFPAGRDGVLRLPFAADEQRFFRIRAAGLE